MGALRLAVVMALVVGRGGIYLTLPRGGARE